MTKTIKTPLMMAEVSTSRTGPLSLCLRASSRTRQQPITVLCQNSAIIVEKAPPFGLKNILRNWCIQKYTQKDMVFSVKRSGTVFLPLMMSIVAKQRVMRSGLVWELAHRHRAMTSPRKLEELKTSAEGFYLVFVHPPSARKSV